MLRELISFVCELPPVEKRRGEPLPDDPTPAPKVERYRGEPPAEREQIVMVEKDLVLSLETTVSLNDLPEDVRKPPQGIEPLAFYRPFHLYPENWGIYLRESGVLVVASILKGSDQLGPDDSDFIELGRKLLLSHEHFHFKAEVACARAEVVAGKRIYNVYYEDTYAAAHEEALANARAYRDLPHEPADLRQRVSDWMEAQGPGYNEFKNWEAPRKFRKGCRRAARHMLKYLHNFGKSKTPAEFLFDSMGRLKSPVYLVLDFPRVRVFKLFPKAYGMQVLVHTREHPPPHIHIQIPPGRKFTRYLWPDLVPLKGNPELSADERKNLDKYLVKYGREIDKKVQQAFPGAKQWKQEGDRLDGDSIDRPIC
jgi:hypothetical protein